MMRTHAASAAQNPLPPPPPAARRCDFPLRSAGMLRSAARPHDAGGQRVAFARRPHRPRHPAAAYPDLQRLLFRQFIGSLAHLPQLVPKHARDACLRGIHLAWVVGSRMRGGGGTWRLAVTLMM